VNEEALAHWGLLRPKEEEEWHEYKHILVETFRPVTLFSKTQIHITVNGN
jgi:hypothetical protein